MNLLNKLPDEIYKLVYSYVFSPKQSIKKPALMCFVSLRLSNCTLINE